MILKIKSFSPSRNLRTAGPRLDLNPYWKNKVLYFSQTSSHYVVTWLSIEICLPHKICRYFTSNMTCMTYFAILGRVSIESDLTHLNNVIIKTVNRPISWKTKFSICKIHLRFTVSLYVSKVFFLKLMFFFFYLIV